MNKLYLFAVIAAVILAAPLVTTAKDDQQIPLTHAAPVMTYPLPIYFKKGDACWTYTGPKTEFIGKFGPLEFVTVNAFAVSPGEFGGAEITNAEISFTANHRFQEGPSFSIGDESPVNLTVYVNYNLPDDDHRDHVTHILICTSGIE